MSKGPSVLVLTHLASPYQVELFNALEVSKPGQVFVIYLYVTSLNRQWEVQQIKHQHLVIGDHPGRFAEARKLVHNAHLVIFNFYNHSVAMRLMRRRATSPMPWCFWGERTGYYAKGWVGRVYRKWRLAPLHSSHAPIWGMGRLAVEQYRREFGRSRRCFNFAYCSNLDRFQRAGRSPRRMPGVTTFLYSGALVYRKGVDLLAEAFANLATRRQDVRLQVLGDGELRSPIALRLQSVRDRVEFLGFRDWKELPEIYRHADVLCAPSRHDGWGLVVPEGLASGMPVISTDRTGAAVELLRPRRNGWLVPAGNAKALEGAMEDAASLSDNDWERISLAASESAVPRGLSAGVVDFWEAVQGTLDHWKQSQVPNS